MFPLNLLLLCQEILIRFLSNHSDFSFISESILYLILVKKTLFSFLWHIYYMLQFILNFAHAFCTSAKVIIDSHHSAVPSCILGTKRRTSSLKC